MTDEQIIRLYFVRDDQAIAATDDKYGHYCHTIARRILPNDNDAEECVNDTYFDVWNTIPPHKPTVLKTFLGKITRRTAIDKYRSLSAQKRGSGHITAVLEELADCADTSFDDTINERLLTAALNTFVRALPTTERHVFLRRYWYAEPIADIAAHFGFSQSKVKSMLARTRRKLRDHLKKEDMYDP